MSCFAVKASSLDCFVDDARAEDLFLFNYLALRAAYVCATMTLPDFSRHPIIDLQRMAAKLG